MIDKHKDSRTDLIKITACLMVLMIHAADGVLYLRAGFLYRCALFIDACARPAIPLFIMVSGTVLFKTEPPLPSIRRRLAQIALPVLYFLLIYYLFDHIMGLASYPIWEIFSLNGSSTKFHLWYLYAVLPLYLLSAYLPFPKPVPRRQSLIRFSFCALIFLLIHGPADIVTGSRMSFGLHTVLLYAFCGYFLKGYVLCVEKRMVRAAGFIVYGAFSIWTYLGQGYFLTQGYSGEGFFAYQSFGVFLQAAGLFAALHTLKETDSPRPGRIASLTLGVYGWHIIWLILSSRALRTFNLPIGLAALLMFFSTLTASSLIAFAERGLFYRIRQNFFRRTGN